MTKLAVARAVSGMAALGLALVSCRRTEQPDARASSGEEAIRLVYQKLEKAVQRGDGALWWDLHSEQTPAGVSAADMEQARTSFLKNFHGRPELHYRILAAAARTDHGVIIGKIESASGANPTFEIVKLAIENGGWKIMQEDVSDSAPDLRLAAALLPPLAGPFDRAGKPWASLPFAQANAPFNPSADLDWQLQAVQDDSFLYLRFEYKNPLPVSGTEISADPKGGPSWPPILKATVKGSGAVKTAFEIQANPVTQTKSTFDANGHAASNRFFMLYALALRDETRNDLLSLNSDDTFTRLIAVQGRDMDIVIPLPLLGLDAQHPGEIELADINTPGKIAPYRVNRFAK